ncbi:hypothetical protein RHSIM_Rhsim06G0104600 [Rhododendron simsii]|uniref:AAA+ ATPase domain-containing protein n=1 Tax=Rhododendron simsii TaxID=118357 RepID=A0A834GZ29_RHOSS|nr:hypothetical protein RHSIM_Rhsim06G0104600 [Rhododendron simsii]
MDTEPQGSPAGGAGDLRQAEERPRVRRRLVQSTLFPQNKSPEIAAEKDDQGCDQEDGGKQENIKTRKRRGRPPTSSKIVAVNGKGIPSRKEGEKDSPPIVKSHVFLQACQGQHPQEEQQCVVSPKANDRTCSPVEAEASIYQDPIPVCKFMTFICLLDMKTPRQLKRRVNSTPKKKQTQTTPKKYTKNTGLKETCLEHISDIQSGNPTQTVPDLWLEAKMKAEEDARIFGGRQMHPFFSSTKMTKNIKKTIDEEGNWCLAGGKEKHPTLSPIHVFEKVQDDAGSLDWGNWIVSERSFISSNCDLKTACSPVSVGSVNSLHFDDSLILYPSRTSLLQSEEVICLDQPSVQERRHAISATSDDAPAVLDEDFNAGHGHPGHIRNSDADGEGRFPHERMKTYDDVCGNHPVNSLWTNKYLPQKAIEVCGNRESVNFLSEWLRLWHERDFRSSKDLSVGKNFIVHDDDYNGYQSDCDFDNRDEDGSLKNVLLVTGPVGSGKSAAIYACAKEQGFHVIEVSASDWRTRALVMQRFEGGVESHSVQRSVSSSILKTPVGTESKLIPKSFPVFPYSTTVQGSDSEVFELIPLSDEEEDSQNKTRTPEKFVSREYGTSIDQTASKPLILFEDVDALLSEDHGLIATIQKLAETAKRPIILTSNNHSPVLPNNLDRLELCFAVPSMKELLWHVHMVCTAEKAQIQPCLVERFIGCCRGDIRKTLMHLQFWCQGWRERKGSEEQRKYGLLLFDLDAGHRILPKIIPWCYPSQLSEIVEKEIANSLLMMEESSKLVEVIVEGDPNKKAKQKRLKRRNKCDTDGIEAKKEAIFRRHCPLQDGNELEAQFTTACEFSSSSGSPVAFTRRISRRKIETVSSSDSGSEDLNDKFPVVRDKLYEDTNSGMLLEVGKSPSCCLATGMCFGPTPVQLLNSEVKKLEGIFSLCSESAIYTQIDGTQKSVDVSYVPESSFVAETEVDGGTSLYNQTGYSCHDADVMEEVSMFNDSMLNMHAVETNNHNQYVSGLHNNQEMVENFNSYIEFTHEEEVGDANNEHVGAVPRGYPVMDECSRMDFGRHGKSKAKPSSWVLMDSVQDTWRRIRGSDTDLRQYVTLEEKNASQVLKLAYGMCNLISEADKLLGDGHQLICDSLEPSMVPHEKTHSFSWYDDQLWMTSTITQHGICFYSKEIAAIGSCNGFVNKMDLASEMLASSSNTTALAKLVSQDMGIENSQMGSVESVSFVQSELGSCISSVMSIVPSRLYLATRGDASFYEYLSSLGQISRLEASRLSESIDDTKQKRVRVARNYLSNGAWMLSPDDISLLGQYHCYGKGSSQTMDKSLR